MQCLWIGSAAMLNYFKTMGDESLLDMGDVWADVPWPNLAK